MLRLGFRNIVTSPNKGWTWSNPSTDLLPLCKASGCYTCITGGQAVSCFDGFHLYLEQLGCVAQVANKYEDRVQSMAKDFHIHQNKWKRYMKIFFAAL